MKLQLHDAIYRLRFYSNPSIHILSLSNSHNNIASIQKNRDDKSYCVIVALALRGRQRILTSNLKIYSVSLAFYVTSHGTLISQYLQTYGMIFYSLDSEIPELIPT